MSASDLASSGYALFVNRALASYAVGAGLACVLPLIRQAPLLDSGWLSLVVSLMAMATVGQIVVTRITDWARGFLVVYAAVVTAAQLTWPLAWQGGTLTGRMFLVYPLVGAVVMLAWAAREVWVAVLVAPVTMVVHAWIRINPAGGSASVASATLEAIVAIAVICGASVAIALCYRAGELLDRSTDRAAALAERTAIVASVGQEQRSLDALVHDQVMTTLAAAGRGTVGRERLAGMAGRALQALGEAGGGDDENEPLTGEAFGELVTSLVGFAAPTAVVAFDAAPDVAVPRPVANALSQATQEAALNAAKHAHAARISVRATATSEGEAVRVAIKVSDNGDGFVVDDIPQGRLGVRLALQSRMQAVGGTASVDSTPGLGTVVRLAWSGRTPEARPAATARAAAPGRFEDNLDFGLLLMMLRLLMAVMLGVQAIQVLTGGGPIGEWGALVALACGGLVALGPGAPRRLHRWEEVVLGVSLSVALAFTGFHVSDVAPGELAFAALYLAVMRVRGRLLPTALAAGAFAVGMVAGGLMRGDLLDAVSGIIVPLFVVLVIDYHVRWLNVVTGRVAKAHADFEAAARRVASVFSTLLRREVWLVGVQGFVEPLMRRLADPTAELTAADRERCVTLEARLRDSITARNLTSPKVAAAIEAARQRGVKVTLVDNRNGPLPESARIAAQEQLALVAAAQPAGRIVARVAPVGYKDSVTIMTDTDDEARLISIGEDGTVSEK